MSFVSYASAQPLKPWTWEYFTISLEFNNIFHFPFNRETLDCFELITFATVATKGFMFGSAAEFIREAENIYQRNKGVMSPMLNADGSKANIDEIIQTFKRNIVTFHNK